MLSNLIFPFDHILIIILLILILFCSIKGFIHSLLALLTWIGSILITIYTYQVFSNYLLKQILNINILQKYEYLVSIASIAISIPVIFLITLFILKKIKNYLNSDFEKSIIGIFFDKLFGLIYGIIFSYIILTSVSVLLNKFELKKIDEIFYEFSDIYLQINNLNEKYIFKSSQVSTSLN